MLDETESAVASWLDSPNTKREVAILRQRFAAPVVGHTVTPFHAAMFVLCLEILQALDIYGIPDGEPDEDDDRPWAA